MKAREYVQSFQHRALIPVLLEILKEFTWVVVQVCCTGSFITIL